jgi:hypothetical protein
MNNKHRTTLEAIFARPVSGAIAWAHIEALLTDDGCVVIEGPGASVTFEKSGRRACFYRPRPNKDALRYQVAATREFLELVG